MIKRLKPTDHIIELVRSGLVDSLKGAQLVVYIKLLAACAAAESRKVEPLNADLFASARTVVSALRRLEELDLISIEYDKTKRPGRTIEVLR